MLVRQRPSYWRICKNVKVDKAETCYYLGEVYSDLNMKDSAAYYYKEGLVADPDYVFNSIGELKLGLKENPNQDSAFDGFFTGKNKKNPLIYIAVGTRLSARVDR